MGALITRAQLRRRPCRRADTHPLPTQAAYERLEAQKLAEVEELNKVQKLATTGVAGRRQVHSLGAWRETREGG